MSPHSQGAQSEQESSRGKLTPEHGAWWGHCTNIFLKDFIYFIFREGKRGETEGEKHQYVVASHVSPTGDLACNPGMYPDSESNQ